jgi:uncharacterized protein (DUF1778 family)
MASESNKTRDLRWDLRVADSEDALVRAASDSATTTFTSFVRDAAVNEARRVLADRTAFDLSEPDWRRFNDLLDRPARVPEGLRHLFTTPSVFE